MYCSKCGVQNNEEARFCKDCGMALGVQQVYAETALVLPASLLQRFIHNFVDSIAMYIFAFAVGYIFMVALGEDIGAMIGLIAFFAYHLIFEFLFQQTIGKMFTGTKVVSLTGDKPSFLALVGRTLARYIPLEALSFLFYGAYPTKGWHDRLSGTLVVPKGLSSEEIRSIDQKKLDEQKGNNTASMIVVVIVGGLFMIAIIGIIAATVLASLGTARSTGEDAATKSTLNSLRAQAELYSVKNDDSYDGFCLDSQTKQLLMGKTITCNDSPNEYAVSAKLNAEGYFCVDSASFTDVIKDDISLNQTLCNRYTTSDTEKIALRRTEGRGRICKIAHEAPSNG
jgi:uncharacterized RDD family membrane protein YckC/type II secretory pathway pseudopilin PulG